MCLVASAAAREVVYQCMVEDYQVFFQPVLHFISQAFQEATKNTRRTPVKRFTHSTEEDIVSDAALHLVVSSIFC